MKSNYLICLVSELPELVTSLVDAINKLTGQSSSRSAACSSASINHNLPITPRAMTFTPRSTNANVRTAGTVGSANKCTVSAMESCSSSPTNADSDNTTNSVS